MGVTVRPDPGWLLCDPKDGAFGPQGFRARQPPGRASCLLADQGALQNASITWHSAPAVRPEPCSCRRVTGQMPHFFFHLYNDIVSMDDEGRELADLEAARRSAVEDARSMAAESAREGRIDLSHYVEVTDERGEPVARVTFGDAVHIVGEH